MMRRMKSLRCAVAVLSLLALSLLGSRPVWADTDGVTLEKVEEIQPQKPNPAAINENSTAEVMVHLKDKNNKEVNPPGTTYTWSCAGVTKTTSDAPNPVDVPNPSVTLTNEQTTTITASFAEIGTYAVKAHFVVANAVWGADTITGDQTETFVVTDTVVRFSSDPIITGYTFPGTISTLHRDVTATVVPAKEAVNIHFEVTGTTNRITMIVDDANTQAGTILLHIYGFNRSTTPGGETTIEAQDNNITKGKAQVIVVIPWAIGPNHPSFNGPVTGVNGWYDATTSPYVTGLALGYVKLATSYEAFLSVPVVDQFGNALDTLYDGTDVVENDNDNMNQQMKQGSYQDPVGAFESPAGSIVLAKSDPVTAWMAPGAPTLPLESGPPETQTIKVKVGGHDLSPKLGGDNLSPAIVNRVVTTIAPNTIIVVWP